MSMNLEQFFPDARPWVENLVNVWPTPYVKPAFAWWEVGHILSLIVLGGTTVLMNLRLIGVGLTQEPPSEIYRSLKTVQTVGVIGIIVTGVLIGMANAERLYDSAAFIVKMLALIGGIILTYGVSRPTARAEGAVSGRAKAWFAVGVAFWLAAIAVFVTGGLIAPGVYHVTFAAALMVAFIARGRARMIYLGIMALLVFAQSIVTHVVISDPFDRERLDPANITFAIIFPIVIVGAALLQLSRSDEGAAGGRLTKLVGYATILVWITAAAAGRWIAFA